MTVALEGTDGILANVLATAVFHGAFVAVREEKRLESRLLHGIVGIKLDSHEIGFRGDHRWYGRPAKDAVNGGVTSGGAAAATTTAAASG